MIDLNESEQQQSRYDLDDLATRLSLQSGSWVPRLFPSGRIESHELRLANIEGHAPRKQGSCIIQLKGAHAGSWHDFSTGDGGGPISAIAHATRLSGRELFEYCADLVGAAPVKINGKAGEHRTTRESKHEAEIARILERAQSTAGTLAEKYFTSARNLPSVEMGDVRFHPDCTHWETQTGWPAIIAIVRDRQGNATGGLHRTYIARDGSSKAQVSKARLSLGPIQGGAVQLSPIYESRLGLTEGIETAIAASWLYGIPTWAALSAENLKAFEFPDGLKHLTVFADRGEAGENAAATLKARAEAIGIKADIELPESDDDFNTDVINGRRPIAERVSRTTPEALTPPQEPSDGSETSSQGEILPPILGDVGQAISRLMVGSKSEVIGEIFKLMIRQRYDEISTEQAMRAIADRTDLTLGTLRNTHGKLLKDAYALPAPDDKGKQKLPDWTVAMILQESGEPKPILENCAKAFEIAPEWHGVLALDEFAQRIVMQRPPPWNKLNGHWLPSVWGDADDVAATRWLQQCGVHAQVAIVHDAVTSVAHANVFHPVRDYLEKQIWDSVPRLDRWLSVYFGSNDSLYERGIGPRWMISAVARIYKPGCKADHILITEGAQGIKKSTGFDVLFSPWFTDEIPDLGSKDAAIQVAGVWCIELGELDALRRAEQSRLKAFLARRMDRYRPPWGRHASDFPRQCIFAGTVNPTGGYLDDPTGGRRFWPVSCIRVDIDALWRDKEQLWAESVHRYKLGERWHIEPAHDADLLDLAKDMQANRQHDEPWSSLIVKHLDDDVIYRNDVSVQDILAGIGVPKDRWDQRSYSRVGNFLQKSGWERYKAGELWRFRRGPGEAFSENHSR